MSIAPTLLEKKVAWVRLYDFDFGDFDEFETEGQAINPSTVSVVVTQGDGALALGIPSVGGTRVQVELSGGTANTGYTLTCSITTTPGGYALSQDGLVSVLP